MSAELTLLFWAIVLAFGQVLLTVSLSIAAGTGLASLVGNREGLIQTGIAGRSERAHKNMLESLLLFSVLILIVQISGLNDNVTALGAHIFVAARLVYGIVYIIGISWLRTLVWLVSVVGMAMIALTIFTAI